MERPICISAGTTAHRAQRSAAATTSVERLDDSVGPRVLAFASLALAACGAFGHVAGAAIGFVLGLPEGVTAQCSTALALVASSLGGIGATFALLRRNAPAAISDASQLGCAWRGAPDATIAIAFLIGGTVSALQVLVSARPPVAWLGADAPAYAVWSDAPAMLFALAFIALVPVATELMFRGLLFATLRRAVGTWPAATMATVAYVSVHATVVAHAPSVLIGVAIIGAIAMALRLRHASLAPAIALHCGANFTLCVVATLG